MSNLYKVLTLCCVVASLAACASIVDGSTQEIEFKSEPAGSHCVVNRDNEEIANFKTDTFVTVDRSKWPMKILCKQKGYKDTVLNIAAVSNPYVSGNLLMGGFIGYAIDQSSGAAHGYPSPITVIMVK